MNRRTVMANVQQFHGQSGEGSYASSKEAGQVGILVHTVFSFLLFLWGRGKQTTVDTIQSHTYIILEDVGCRH